MQLVSIVVPHRNNCDGLRRLLLSIGKNPNIRTIVVDDNSSPDQRNFLFDLEKEFGFDLVLNNNPGFAGRARNIGLDHVKTQWVVFADSDDVFADDFAEILAVYWYRDDLDVVYFNVTSFNEAGGESYRHIDYSRLVDEFLSGKDSERRIAYLYTPPWGKLINFDLLKKNNIRFDEVPASNDIFFSVLLANFSKNIEVCGNVIYKISQRTGSITNTISVVNLQSKFDSAIKVNLFLSSIGKKKYRHSVLYFFYRAFTIDFFLFLRMVYSCVASGNNPFIGIGKIFKYRSIVRMRESR